MEARYKSRGKGRRKYTRAEETEKETMAMPAADVWRAGSKRSSASEIWRGGDDVFSRSTRNRENEDDEEALKWAALEKLPLTSASTREFSTTLQASTKKSTWPGLAFKIASFSLIDCLKLHPTITSGFC